MALKFLIAVLLFVFEEKSMQNPLPADNIILKDIN